MYTSLPDKSEGPRSSRNEREVVGWWAGKTCNSKAIKTSVQLRERSAEDVTCQEQNTEWAFPRGTRRSYLSVFSTSAAQGSECGGNLSPLYCHPGDQASVSNENENWEPYESDSGKPVFPGLHIRTQRVLPPDFKSAGTLTFPTHFWCLQETKFVAILLLQQTYTKTAHLSVWCASPLLPSFFPFSFSVVNIIPMHDLTISNPGCNYSYLSLVSLWVHLRHHASSSKLLSDLGNQPTSPKKPICFPDFHSFCFPMWLWNLTYPWTISQDGLDPKTEKMSD